MDNGSDGEVDSEEEARQMRKAAEEEKKAGDRIQGCGEGKGRGERQTAWPNNSYKRERFQMF